MMNVDVIVPTFRPGREFRSLLEKLQTQTLKPRRIIVINTRAEGVDMSSYAAEFPIELHEIPQSEFDHGGTRDLAAGLSDAPVMIFMTQDAVPANEYLIEELVKPFANGKVAVSYARQLPREDCSLVECYTRVFNYPAEDRLKTEADKPELGIKTYFCSDVCAAYRKTAYIEMGGFRHPLSFNEDMIMAGMLAKAGYGIYYASKAQVVHSHNYTLRQQYERNKALARSQAQNPDIFGDLKSESEGKRLVMTTAKQLLQEGHPLQIFPLIFQSGAKYLGYRVGRK